MFSNMADVLAYPYGVFLLFSTYCFDILLKRHDGMKLTGDTGVGFISRNLPAKWRLLVTVLSITPVSKK